MARVAESASHQVTLDERQSRAARAEPDPHWQSRIGASLPMSLELYVAFLGVSLLVICTPGQDTALTIRNTLLGGRRAGVATAAGVSVGQATWTIATSAGLAVVLMASAPLFTAVRLADPC